MKSMLLIASFIAGAALAADAPKPSGPVKVFKGPEGEKVVMVLANADKQMLVHVKNTGSEFDNQTRLYEVYDMGEGKKDVFYMKKRGSKSYQYNVLVQRNNTWEFYNPTKDNQHFVVSYSEEESGKISADDVLKAYKP